VKVSGGRLALGAVAALALIQAYRPSRANPPMNVQQDISVAMSLDPEVRSIIDRSCNDCHSDRTVWPWYSEVAPVSWGVASDVHDGRRHMNFSEWGSYPDYKRKDLLDKVCKMVTQHDMPPFTYSLIHRESGLSQTDRDAICRWTKANTEGK
jgi:hypothetical protein